ncbi:nucleotidyltransferase [Clostridium sp. Cult2]|uniref:nucleotidyltransferase n=1 Tax=Clostridium sp. Cult2 TaxID=2079003 RepID=UPI001F2AED19|nr:nucleotidyltransferase [Clostridium sp. Cult2]MCF6466414.1 nucleotidyltransferase [Clostridium sp. Cult2]
MKVIGLITEYNPFHLGHKYHLTMSKKLTNSDYSVAIMSGSFVQRGEPSLVDKWTKAKMAIDNGVDLVIELPFIFSTQSAELFAYGSIALLHNLNIIDYVVFGSELGSLDCLREIAQILVEEPPYYRECLKKYLDEGNSFSVSRSNALEDYFNKFKTDRKNNINIKDILKMSNNILAIEYLKALMVLNSKIQPVTVKRIGSSYTESQINHEIASATGIRNKIINGNIESVKKYLPIQSYVHLINYINKYKNFNMLDNYTQIIHYLLKISPIDNLVQTMDVETGLENRIVNQSAQYYNINDLIQGITTKRYTKTRIQRILIHLMANLTKPIFKDLYPQYPTYIRVLGANQKGFLLLNRIKEESNLPIIVKFSDYNKYDDPYLNKILFFDKKATDLFFLGLNTKKPYMNMDYYTTPYIKKK